MTCQFFISPYRIPKDASQSSNMETAIIQDLTGVDARRVHGDSQDSACWPMRTILLKSSCTEEGSLSQAYSYYLHARPVRILLFVKTVLLRIDDVNAAQAPAGPAWIRLASTAIISANARRHHFQIFIAERAIAGLKTRWRPFLFSIDVAC
jgi:hypothetical protein